jgi:hypothetical protein
MSRSAMSEPCSGFVRSAARFTALLAASLFLLLLAVPVSLRAQVRSGSLSGTVADSTGAVVPNATVILKDQATNSTRQTVSNSYGFFNFSAVQPSTYTVTVTAPGFNTWEEKDIAFTQAASLTLPNIKLEVASAKQTVEVVSAGEVSVPTDTGQTSQTLNEHMISELAIQGRDAAELIKIMPGMAMATGLGQQMFSSLVTQSNSGPIGQFSANGTQPNGGMTMTMDGANLLDPGNQGTQTANVNQNQIAEATILTTAFDASFAKGPVTMQFIGKSGTAQFHGDAYLYTRNADFNAEDSLLKASGIPKPYDYYYYPGGDLGGPVVIPGTNFNHNHDKLFFYGAYEYMDQHPSGSLIQRFIPTQQMMSGNFSPAYIASLGSNFANGPFSLDAANPCVVRSCTNGVTLANGMIPAGLLDPNSAALYKTMPQPNLNPVTNPIGANYEYLNQEPVNRWEARGRIDYNLSENTKMFFSYDQQNEQDLNPISIWWATGNAIPYPSMMPANQVSKVFSANVTHVFSPTLTNEFVFSEATFINPITLSNPAAVNPANVGFHMTGLFNDPYTPQIPNTISWSNSVPGYFAPTFGQQFQGGAFGKYSATPNISDNISKVAGTHTLKFGFYWDFAQNQQTSSNFLSANQGVTEFENYGANSSGNPAADFAMGRITGFYQTNTAPVANFYYHQYSFYANDQWKATRRLTLTYGIRFDHMGQWDPVGSNGLAVWDPATYNNTSSAGPWTGLLWHSIDPAIPMSGFPSKNFFYEPRFGLAYDVFGTGNTVIRGGFGVYRYQLSYNDVSGGAYSAPLGSESLSTTWNCCIGYNSFNQFTPSLGPAGLGSGVAGVLQMGDSRTPYTEDYNFTISQRVPWNSLLEVYYSGSQSHDLIINGPLSNLDNIPLGAFYGPDPLTGQINNPYSSNFPTNDYYPLHNYTQMQLVTHNSYSNYNALVVTWQKQTGRVTFTTNYTWSKLMGIRDNYTGNGTGAGNTLWPYALAPNYGVLGYDHAQIFNAAYVINLPDATHKNKFLAGALNGWELSGITQFQTGAPIQPNSANGILNVQYGSNNGQAVGAQQYLGTNSMQLLPILTCNPGANLKSGQYFNPNCFAPPAPGQVGPIVWPTMWGPAFFNSDLSLYKNFKMTERQTLQFRLEAFNFLNHPLPEFNATGSNADMTLKFANSSGQLTQTNQNQETSGSPLNTVGRRVVEFAVKYMF